MPGSKQPLAKLIPRISRTNNGAQRFLASLLPSDRTGPPRKVQREVDHAEGRQRDSVYLNRSGCQWRACCRTTYFPRVRSTITSPSGATTAAWREVNRRIADARVRVAADEADPQCGLHRPWRKPVGEDHRGRRRRTGLRRRQENQGAKAAFAGRYARFADRGADPLRASTTAPLLWWLALKSRPKVSAAGARSSATTNITIINSQIG